MHLSTFLDYDLQLYNTTDARLRTYSTVYCIALMCQCNSDYMWHLQPDHLGCVSKWQLLPLKRPNADSVYMRHQNGIL